MMLIAAYHFGYSFFSKFHTACNWIRICESSVNDETCSIDKMGTGFLNVTDKYCPGIFLENATSKFIVEFEDPFILRTLFVLFSDFS